MEKRHLNGWKEIGSYLGRAGRTAQRWEAQLGMPVHRPAKRKRTVVVGFPGELDAWLMRNRSYLESEEAHELPDIAALGEKLIRLQTEATQLALELQRARGEVAELPQTSATEMATFTDGSD
jgi:hypothetical protein